MVFPAEDIKPIIVKACQDILGDKNLDQVIQLACYDLIAKEITTQLQDIPQYKWMVQVTTQQLCTITMASQCIWDKSTDGLCEHIHKTPEFIVAIVVYGCKF